MSLDVGGAIIGGGLSLFGGLLGSSAKRKAARRARKIGKLNEADFFRQAVDAADRKRESERQLYFAAAKAFGQREAAQGAAGLNVDFGSAALANAEAREMMTRDAATIRANADNEIKQLLFNAKIARLGGQAQSQALRAQGLGDLLSGVGGAVQSAASLYKAKP